MKVLKYSFLVIILLIQFSCASLDARKIVLLPKDLIYRHRLLLVFTPRQDLLVYQRQEEMLVENVEGLAARDVQVYRLFPRNGLNPENSRLNSAQVLSLRNKYQVDEDQFVNVFVDKDGEVKLRKAGLLAPADLFNFIDTLYVQ